MAALIKQREEARRRHASSQATLQLACGAWAYSDRLPVVHGPILTDCLWLQDWATADKLRAKMEQVYGATVDDGGKERDQQGKSATVSSRAICQCCEILGEISDSLPVMTVHCETRPARR